MLEVISKSASLILVGSATFLMLTYALTSRKWHRSPTGRILMSLMVITVLGLGLAPFSYIPGVRWVIVGLKFSMAVILIGIAVAIENTQVAHHRKKGNDEGLSQEGNEPSPEHA